MPYGHMQAMSVRQGNGDDSSPCSEEKGQRRKAWEDNTNSPAPITLQAGVA